MARGNSAIPQLEVEESPAEATRASVSFDLTLEELSTLVNLCGNNGLFHLGISLAERKSRLKANIARMEKDAEKAAAGGDPE